MEVDLKQNLYFTVFNEIDGLKYRSTVTIGSLDSGKNLAAMLYGQFGVKEIAISIGETYEDSELVLLTGEDDG